MKIESIAIDQLQADPSNARKHNKKNLDAIKGSLTKFGQQKPIVVDAKNIVIAGNGTLFAAKELGWKELSIVRSDLIGPEATAFAIADNRTSELSEWDDDILKQTLAGLDIAGFDLKEIGFSEKDLDLNKDNQENSNEPDQFLPKYEILVTFNDEHEQQQFFSEMQERGLSCVIL